MSFRDALSHEQRIVQLERDMSHMYRATILSLLKRIDSLESRVRELETGGSMGAVPATHAHRQVVVGHAQEFGYPAGQTAFGQAIQADQARQRYEDHQSRYFG